MGFAQIGVSLTLMMIGVVSVYLLWGTIQELIKTKDEFRKDTDVQETEETKDNETDLKTKQSTTEECMMEDYDEYDMQDTKK